MEEMRGWLSGSKGRRYLATDEGWFELLEPDGTSWSVHGEFDRSPVRLAGERRPGNCFAVSEVRDRGPVGDRRPPFVVTPPLLVHRAARARLEVDRLLAERGIPQVMLPALWVESREYGEEELSIAHTSLDEPLVLLQSPEFPMYATLAQGVGAFYCWGRSYRFEPNTAGQHLMEFEQIDIGLSHSNLNEMMDIVEAVIRVVAETLGTKLLPGRFPVQNHHTSRPMSGISALQLHEATPSAAVEIIMRRLREVGAGVRLLDEAVPTLVIETPDEATAERAAAVMDSVERLTTNELPHAGTQPLWESPLPLEWDEREGAVQSEHKIRSLTSARVLDAAGTEWIAEAELYIRGIEVAHAGVFADHETFLRNVRDAEVPSSRHDWLVPMLEAAPPGMVKVGIGWERLVTVLAGGGDAMEAQLFPRLGSGQLLRQFTS